MLTKEEVFAIEDSTLNFADLSHEMPTLSWENIGILILPSDEEHKAFYAGTLEMLDYFSAHLNPGEVDIFASDEDYRQLTLHSKELWIGTFLIGSVVVPLFVNLISSYIYDHLKADANNNVTITVVVQKKNGSSKSIHYVGKAEKLGTAVDAIKELAE